MAQLTKIERMVDAFPGNPTQEQFVWLMNTLREGSWDIPSALFIICQDFDDLYFPMHRPAMTEAEEEDWTKLDPHFQQMHLLDLNDPKINWEFDT